MKTDIPLSVISEPFAHRICDNHEGIRLLGEPKWHGEYNDKGNKLYHCLANVNGALCMIAVTITTEIPDSKLD